MAASLSKRLTLGLFAVSIFVSAFLLFQVQPIIGKFVLPWFGGSPGVWTTCMLFFQVTLFAGYSYAHVLHRLLTIQRQIVLHCCLLLLALLTLPITPSMDWKPAGDESPTWLILSLLLCKVGAPYFLLSSTGPLLQSWLGSSSACERPYRLYSLSNVGSMLALLSFPFLIEPSLSSSQQSVWWSWAFASFAVLCSASGLVLYRAKLKSSIVPGDQGALAIEKARASTWTDYLNWFSLPCLASVLLLATTNQLCVDTGSIPFLWIAPLAVYLLSFILTFDSDRWYNRRVFIMLAASALMAIYGIKMQQIMIPLPVEIGLYLTGLLACCMVCHGEVVALKPCSTKLTSFYLTMSAGGACGGIFVGLIAPTIFRGYFEWQLSLLACILLFAELYLSYNPSRQRRVTPSMKVITTATILVASMVALSIWQTVGSQQLAVKRNFYGVLSVRRQVDQHTGVILRNMVHGRIVHGSQFEAADHELDPTAYYTVSSGVGQLFQSHKVGQSRNIGIVGLGAGTLATYATAQDQLRFYEINPDVIQFAQDYFSFLKSTPAKLNFVLGDARLMLEREAPQQFDILVLDAFSGDAIPVHLLTEEAMRVYDSHLKNDGVLALHISNLYFDLKPIARGLANSLGYHSRVVVGRDDPTRAALYSTWVLMSRAAESVQQVVVEGTDASIPQGKAVLWTDDRNNLFDAIQ
jgi:hypothetical protein